MSNVICCNAVQGGKIKGRRVAVWASLRRRLLAVPFQFHVPLFPLSAVQSTASRAPYLVRESRRWFSALRYRDAAMFVYIPISRHWLRISSISKNYLVLCQFMVSMASVYGVWQCGWGMVCGFSQWSKSSAPQHLSYLCRISRVSVKLDVPFR